MNLKTPSKSKRLSGLCSKYFWYDAPKKQYALADAAWEILSSGSLILHEIGKG